MGQKQGCALSPATVNRVSTGIIQPSALQGTLLSKIMLHCYVSTEVAPSWVDVNGQVQPTDSNPELLVGFVLLHGTLQDAHDRSEGGMSFSTPSRPAAIDVASPASTPPLSSHRPPFVGSYLLLSAVLVAVRSSLSRFTTRPASNLHSSEVNVTPFRSGKAFTNTLDICMMGQDKNEVVGLLLCATPAPDCKPRTGTLPRVPTGCSRSISPST